MTDQERRHVTDLDGLAADAEAEGGKNSDPF